MRTSRRGFVAGASAFAVLGANSAFAQKKYDDGATDKEIKIGHTGPYSGPASSYGQIGKTIEAFFKSVNEAGGVNGRKISLTALDDGYETDRTVANTNALINDKKVFALMAYYGSSPTTSSAVIIDCVNRL